jgi:hypothetical protein
MRMLVVSVALVAASVASANAQTPSPTSNIAGSGQFCIHAAPGGNANCIYQSTGDCEIAKKTVNSSGECVSRAQLSGTTGSGASSLPVPATPPAAPPEK